MLSMCLLECKSMRDAQTTATRGAIVDAIDGDRGPIHTCIAHMHDMAIFGSFIYSLKRKCNIERDK